MFESLKPIYFTSIRVITMEDFKIINSKDIQSDSLKPQSSISTKTPHFFSEYQTASDKTRKRKRNTIDDNGEEILPNKKSKLISEIEQIAINFLNLIEGKYELIRDESGQSMLTIKISSFEEVTLTVDKLPRFYRKIAQIILGNKYSVVELIEYLMQQNYDWSGQGKFKEKLMHYLIMLPDSVQAVNKFESYEQENLINQDRDQQGCNPLEALTQLYIENLDSSELYENLKASFDIISDFDDCYQESSLDDLKFEQNINSAFNIMLFSIDNVLKLDNQSIIENYLEILALMCQHTEEPENNEQRVQECLTGYESSENYLTWFGQYCEHYTEKDQELSLKEEGIQLAESKIFKM